MPVPIKKGEPCCMSCSPSQATSASQIASSVSPWPHSARRIERRPPKHFVRSSTRRRQSSPALVCVSASQCSLRGVSGLPFPALRPSAAHPRPLPRPPNRRRNRTFSRYPMSGALNLGRCPPNRQQLKTCRQYDGRGALRLAHDPTFQRKWVLAIEVPPWIRHGKDPRSEVA